MKRAVSRSSIVPKEYRRVNIQYSYLGVEDFDFGHYNQTSFCGLEIHIQNAYCNAMLQVLYFLAPFRASMQAHWCDNEFCLACELGFLFHTLDQVPGRNCQATNFLRSFRTIPQAGGLGLILSDLAQDLAKADLQTIIQAWHTFILTQVDHDERTSKEDSTSVSRIWGVPAEASSVCSACEVRLREAEAGREHRSNREKKEG